MSTLNGIKVISSDSHVLEPPDLWTSRMHSKWGDRIPKVIAGQDADHWVVDGEEMGIIGTFGASAGMRFENPGDIVREGRYEDIRKGGFDPHARMEDLQLDGVHADFLYPSFAMEMYAIPDTQLLQGICSAYNDWLIEYCAAYPDKLKGIAMIALDDDIETGISEIRRCANLGLVGAMITVWPRPGETYDHPMYDPFWSTAQELNIPLSLHQVTNRSVPKAPDADTVVISQSGAGRVNADYWVRMSLCHMIYSGVFERYPDLNVINVENDLAWLPYFINRLDVTYIERPTQTAYRFKDGVLPSDIMRRNVHHSFQEDGIGIRDRDIIGVETLMWGSDYPHAESTFPKSREILDSILEGVSEEEKAMIVGGNCAKLYNLE
ncbi:amidohydrolase [SAR202 cluster bacterium AD-804-J14_MRT_500m]|nr:amidohydrolase [SAR202 cluster bacterium AD-804-J14_MRT_500m]